MTAALEMRMFGVTFQGLPEAAFGILLAVALVLSAAAFLWNLWQWASSPTISGCGGESPASLQRERTIARSGAVLAGVAGVCVLTSLVLLLKNG